MHTKDEALKMAIKLMKEENLDLTDAYQACKEALEQPITRDWKETIDERIAKDDEFKKALAQPAQEHCVNLKMDKCEHKNICKHCTHPAPQPAQEPVVFSESDLDMFQDNAERYNLTTAHPAPSWQGLSDDEIVRTANGHLDCVDEEYIKRFARAIEQALKEKNHG